MFGRGLLAKVGAALARPGILARPRSVLPPCAVAARARGIAGINLAALEE